MGAGHDQNNLAWRLPPERLLEIQPVGHTGTVDIGAYPAASAVNRLAQEAQALGRLAGQ